MVKRRHREVSNYTLYERAIRLIQANKIAAVAAALATLAAASLLGFLFERSRFLKQTQLNRLQIKREAERVEAANTVIETERNKYKDLWRLRRETVIEVSLT